MENQFLGLTKEFFNLKEEAIKFIKNNRMITTQETLDEAKAVLLYMQDLYKQLDLQTRTFLTAKSYSSLSKEGELIKMMRKTNDKIDSCRYMINYTDLEANIERKINNMKENDELNEKLKVGQIFSKFYKTKFFIIVKITPTMVKYRKINYKSVFSSGITQGNYEYTRNIFLHDAEQEYDTKNILGIKKSSLYLSDFSDEKGMWFDKDAEFSITYDHGN